MRSGVPSARLRFSARRPAARVAAWTAAVLLVVVSVAAAQDADLLITEQALAVERRAMIDLLRSRGIGDDRLLEAFDRVPRHLFVPEELRGEAYADRALAVGDGQTIHQPYVVALMTSLLELDRGAKVLEIGTGTGYHSAILAQLSRQVFSIEIKSDVAAAARANLRRLGLRNVHVLHADGYQGWPSEAPFDAIILTAAPPRIPQPLLDQLAIDGKMVVPVGDLIQDLQLVTKRHDGLEKRRIVPVSLPRMSGSVREDDG